jgi:hypothetical protein
MTTPPGTVEIPPLTAEEISKIADDFEAFAGTLRANTAGRAAIARLVVNARLGLEAAQWKAAADLAQAGEYARAQQLTLCERERDELKAALANAAPRVAGHIDIVFDGPPGHIAGRFVEVEDETGKSIGIGDWIKPSELTGGFWRLRIPRHRLNQAEATKWLDVTAELRDRVAKLEATSKLAERVTERSAKLWPAPDAGKASPVDDVWVRVRGIRYPMQETLRPATEGMDGSFISIAVGHWRTCWAPYFDDDGSRYPMSSVPLSLEGCLKLVAGKRDAQVSQLAEERSEHRATLNQASQERQAGEAKRAGARRMVCAARDRLVQALGAPGGDVEMTLPLAVEVTVDAIAKLKHDLEIALDDRDQAEQDAEAGSRSISQRDVALAAMASFAYRLRVERGKSVEETRDRIDAKLVELLGSQKAASKHDDLARRIRESDFIQRLGGQQIDTEDDAWVNSSTDGDLLDHIFARINHCEVLEDQISDVLSVASNVRLDGAVMIDDAAGTPEERMTAAIARARFSGKHEADAERATLIAKLQLAREALGATLQQDGTDDVVDLARAARAAGAAGRFSDIGKSQAFKRMADEHVLREAFADAVVANWLVNGEARPSGSQPPERAVPDERHRPGHARVTISIWPNLAEQPMFDRPTYAVCVEMGVDSLAKFQANAASALAKLLATWGSPGLDSVREAPGLKSVSGPLTTAANGAGQILRDVIAATMASGLGCPADVFEVKHIPAGERPPRCELRVYAKHQSTVDHPAQIVAYVELGRLWLITLPEERRVATCKDFEPVGSPFLEARDAIGVFRIAYRWHDRIHAAMAIAT